MKKLISLLYLIACTQLMFANLKDLKVGDTFEYRIENFKTKTDFNIITIEIEPGYTRDSLTNIPSRLHESVLSLKLKFSIKKILSDTMELEVIPTFMSFYEKEKNVTELRWINMLSFNSELNTPQQNIINLFPHFTRQNFHVKITPTNIKFDSKQYSSIHEIKLLEKIFCFNSLMSKNNTTCTLKDSTINSISYEIIEKQNPRINQEYYFNKDEKLPQHYFKKTILNKEQVVDLKEFIEIKKVNVHNPIFKTNYYPNIASLNNIRDTSIYRPNTRLTGTLGKNEILKIQIDYPNYYQNRYIVYEIECDENGNFELLLNIDQAVKYQINWKYEGILTPEDEILMDDNNPTCNSIFYNDYFNLINEYKSLPNNTQLIENFLDSTKYLVNPTVWHKSYYDFQLLKFKNIRFKNKKTELDSFKQCFQLDNFLLCSSELFTISNFDQFNLWGHEQIRKIQSVNNSHLKDEKYAFYIYNIIPLNYSDMTECLVKYLWIKNIWVIDYNHKNAEILYEQFLSEYPDSKYTKELIKFRNKYSSVDKGQKAYNFTLKNLENEIIHLNNFRGKVVYILFWTESNSYSIEQLKNFNALQSKNPDIEFLFINQGDESKTILELIAKFNIQCTQAVMDTPEETYNISDKFKIEMSPRATIIDRNGNFFNYHAPLPSNLYSASKELNDAQLIKSTAKQTLQYIINLALPIVVLFLIGLGIYYTRKQRKLKRLKQIKELELKAIRSQMNPHFVFNALNSIQGLVNTNKKEEANLYLSKFATLLRNVLENSEQTFISLEDELEAVKTYCELEKMRIDFDFEIEIDPAIKTNEIEISGMLIQPLIENAIVHGLAAKTDNRKLKLSIDQTKDYLIVIVADNGIGILPNQIDKLREKGFGLKLVEERVNLMKLEKKKVHFEVLPYGINKEQGITVKFVFPIH